MIVRSLTDHWSAGIFGSASGSTYDNTELVLSAMPAVEYNLFPYSESTRQQLRFLYIIGWNSNRYMEETIFNKTSEMLFGQKLSVTLDVRKTWGSAEVSVEGSHYFHDFSKRRLEVFGEVSLRLFEGLSLDVFGGYSRIHDQLSLPKGGATTEEVLLRRTELETNYQYFASIGLSYTFGSIYSNIVNPRFGD